jgi:hypothetical protein
MDRKRETETGALFQEEQVNKLRLLRGEKPW